MGPKQTSGPPRWEHVPGDRLRHWGQRDADGRGGREHRARGPAACVWEKPEDSSSQKSPRWAGQLQLHRWAEQKENRGPQASNERKMVFLWSQGFFVLSKHKGLLMGKGIFELLENALGMENWAEAGLCGFGGTLWTGDIWRPFSKAQRLVHRTC